MPLDLRLVAGNLPGATGHDVQSSCRRAARLDRKEVLPSRKSHSRQCGDDRAEDSIGACGTRAEHASTASDLGPAIAGRAGKGDDRTMKAEDVAAALLAPVVVITSTLSYAALIFSGPLAAALPLGIGNGLITAGLMAVAFALFSGVPFAIAGPDSKTVAVLASLASMTAAEAAERGRLSEAGMTALVAIVVGTLVTGIALYLFGALKTGRWIRFVPYPVIGGFMAASGWLLAAGGVQVLTGAPLSLALIARVATGQHLLNLMAGLVFAVAIHLARKIRHSLALPVLLFGGTAAVHLGLLAAGVSVQEARHAGWLLDMGSGTLLAAPTLLLNTHPDAGTLIWAAGEYVALIAVTAMTLLLSLSAIEVETGVDVDFDRELRLNGLSNLLCGLMAGMVGTLSVGRTLLNHRSGAHGRASGVLAGTLCLAALAFGTNGLGLFPVPLLGGLLLQLGADLLDEWVVKSWRVLQKPDYIQVLVIMMVIVWWDFVAGVAVGILSACISFAVNASRIRLVRLGLSRSSCASRVDRPTYEHEELVRHGGAIQIVWLHGFIFFGSAHRLLLHIRQIMATQGTGGGRSLILDFRQVLGIDSSAVLSLMRLRQLAASEGVFIAMSDLPAAVHRSLEAGGLFAEEHVVRVLPDLDTALELCEDRLLNERMSGAVAHRSADEWLSGEMGSPTLFARLVPFLQLAEISRASFCSAREIRPTVCTCSIPDA
jgi:SulP family sulfate permease